MAECVGAINEAEDVSGDKDPEVWLQYALYLKFAVPNSDDLQHLAMSTIVKLLSPSNLFGTGKSNEAVTTTLQSSSSPSLDIENIIEDKDIIGTREDLVGVPGGFLIHNVLTPEECAKFVQMAEKLGFREAGGAGDQQYPSMPDMRHPADNVRASAKASHPVLMHMWKRVRQAVPTYIEDMDKKWKVVEDDTTALNEQFRFLRYDANQRFRPHFDGGFKRGTSEQTHFTFIVYLNDDFEGGETVFFPGNQTGFHTKIPREEVRVRPKIGTAVVFRHTGPNSPLHEGAPHSTNGIRKYALRTDIMYKVDNQ